MAPTVKVITLAAAITTTVGATARHKDRDPSRRNTVLPNASARR
ncbi:hypothetical protein F4560_008706 [Saccharothrix ecbatanensis]|uniref:Uncharacterized protein n=1 Tax=Saccharothrix ecbatanensis TaxID=1105145 RepID=A0A7W9HUY5_9PSEU|nr:hypothetical protein [Saccharothrix ecbatanensis]MBB5808938.1 hypothetical protein [Saccharothrix ecbatanensis]